MVSRASSVVTRSAAASDILRRRMYSENGIAASDENIRRRWCSVVPARLAMPAASTEAEGSVANCDSASSTAMFKTAITGVPPFASQPATAEAPSTRSSRVDAISNPSSSNHSGRASGQGRAPGPATLQPPPGHQRRTARTDRPDAVADSAHPRASFHRESARSGPSAHARSAALLVFPSAAWLVRAPAARALNANLAEGLEPPQSHSSLTST